MPRSTNLVLRTRLFPEAQLGSWELLRHKASFYQVSQGSGAKHDLISRTSHREDPLPQDSLRKLSASRQGTGCGMSDWLLVTDCPALGRMGLCDDIKDE